MNIAIIGYGKMGKEIEKTALERGHNIVCVIEEDLNVRQVEKIARELVESQTVGKGVKKQSDYIPESFKKQIDNISKSLNMSVKLNRNNRGKGSITINFKNDEEFDKLINIISNNK